MKSWFAKFRSLESALRQSKPAIEVPATLHNSIMRAVHAAYRAEDAQVTGFSILHRVVGIRWLPVMGIASLALLGTWLAFSHQRKTSNGQSLPEISTAFTVSQEVVDTFPSAAVGPLSNELDNVGRDFDRTAEFLLATLP